MACPVFYCVGIYYIKVCLHMLTFELRKLILSFLTKTTIHQNEPAFIQQPNWCPGLWLWGPGFWLRLWLLVVVQSLHHVWLFVTPRAAARQASLSFTISYSLLQLMPIELVMPSNHLVLCRPFLLLPSIFPSINWPKYWSFSFSISPSNEYSGLISFRIDWFDNLIVPWTL